MVVFTTAIFVIMSISIVVIYFSYIILTCALEKYFIANRSKGEILIPILALVVSLILFLLIGKNGMEFEKIDKLCINYNSEKIGEMYYIADSSNNLLHLGQLILIQNDKAKYLDMDIHRNIISVKQSNSRIARSVKFSMQREGIKYAEFSGTSETYGQLSDYQVPVKNKKIFKIILMQGLVLFMPPVILLAIYLSSKYKRKKRNMLMKMKLNDL